MKIIDKIKKLLNLSKDKCNQHVAEAAAGKAQQLIQEHNISSELLGEEGSRESPDWRGFIFQTGINHAWAVDLCKCLSQANHGVVGIWPGTGVKFCGSERDYQVVKYLYGWICCQMNDLASGLTGQGMVAVNSYKMGIVSTIEQRFDEAREKAAAKARIDAMLNELEKPAHALALVENAIEALNDYAELSKIRASQDLGGVHQGGRGAGDLASFSQGVEDGRKVKLEGGQTAGRLT